MGGVIIKWCMITTPFTCTPIFTVKSWLESKRFTPQYQRKGSDPVWPVQRDFQSGREEVVWIVYISARCRYANLFQLVEFNRTG